MWRGKLFKSFQQHTVISNLFLPYIINIPYTQNGAYVKTNTLKYTIVE